MQRGGTYALACAALLSLATPSGVVALDVADINEGELRFLTEPPAQSVHLHQSRAFISAESLKSGWVRAEQCHYRLDKVAALEVTFNSERVRALRILRADHIARARIEGATVQLEEIGDNAVLCIESEVHAMRRLADGSHEWRGGPYMRRFLDGYFPMQLDLTVEYPASLLRIASLDPIEIAARTTDRPGYLRLDTFFEGRLELTIRFAPLAAGH